MRLQAGLCAIYRPSSSSQLPSSSIISHTHSHTASAPFCLPLCPSPSLYLCCPLSLFSLSVSLCPSASSFLANYCETPSNINCFAILRGFLITNRRAGVRTYSVGAAEARDSTCSHLPTATCCEDSSVPTLYFETGTPDMNSARHGRRHLRHACTYTIMLERFRVLFPKYLKILHNSSPRT